ncbi:MAG: DsbA family protein [Aliidongia sp.]
MPGAVRRSADRPGRPVARAASPVPPVGPADSVLGRADAPVTVIEYGSLTCPHCAAFDQSLFPRLKTEWIDAGKIRVVFRDFPRDRVDLQAFQLAHCDHGRLFWPLLESLFQNQASWVKARDPAGALIRLGKLAGLPEASARVCLADQSLARASTLSLQAGSNAGVETTPSFFVNGRKIALWSYEDWQKALKEAGAR